MPFTNEYLQFCWRQRTIWIHKTPKIGDWMMRLDPPELSVVHDPDTQGERLNDAETAYIPDLDDLLEWLHQRISGAGFTRDQKQLQLSFSPENGWSALLTVDDGKGREIETHIVEQTDPHMLLFRLMLAFTEDAYSLPDDQDSRKVIQ